LKISTKKPALAHAKAGFAQVNLTELASKLFNFSKSIGSHKAWARVDVVAWQDAVAVIVGQNHNWQVSLQEWLLVDTPVDYAGLQAFNDFFAKVECTELNDYRLTPVGSLFECNSRY